jgi:hypothetical protein
MKQFLNAANRILFSVNCMLTIVVLALTIYAPFVVIWCGNLFIWVCNISICVASFGGVCSLLPQMPYTWFSTQYWLALGVYIVFGGGWLIPIGLGLMVSSTKDVVTGKGHLT